MARLARKRLGRLVLVLDHHPEVFPVNYGLDDNVVVFRTRPGTRLVAAHQAHVAFHVDHHDEATRSGWSVLVQGMAEDVTDRTDDLSAQRTGLSMSTRGYPATPAGSCASSLPG